MRVHLVVVLIVNRLFIKGQTNMEAGARQINIGILFTSRKLLSIDSEPKTGVGQKPACAAMLKQEEITLQ